jgi:hypothetical protein
MMTTMPNIHVRRIAAFTALSWLGAFVHNMADLPGITLLSPENTVPAVILIVLFLAWWKSPNKRLTSLTLLVWVLFAQFLIGGILSVIPLPFWPFNPPQTAFHYLMHLIFALAQLPLIVALLRQPRLNIKNKTIYGVSV